MTTLAPPTPTRVALPAGRHQARLELADAQDHISRQITRFRRFYEQDLLTDIKTRLAGRQGVAVDVGAHIGNHTVWLALACGLPVVALEPNPSVREQLERNIELNHITSKTRVISAAAGRQAGRARLVSARAGNSGTARVAYAEAGSVEVVALDDLGLADVAVIKIDVESQELAVLEGARELLRSQQPLVYVEAATEQRRRAVDAFLHDLGYRSFGVYAKTPTYGYEKRGSADVRVSVAIMAHPRRARFAHELAQQLPEAEIVWDRRNDRWDTGRRSMLAHDPDATHHIVIQDDAVIPPNLLTGVKAALSERSEYPVGFYLGRQRPNAALFQAIVRQAIREDKHWIAHSQLCWGVAVCIPTAIIKPMIAWCDENPRWANYDMRLSRYLEQAQIPTLYTYPSLVDHRRHEENPSLVPGRTGTNRVAHSYIGDQDPAAVDWGGDVLLTPMLRRTRPHL